ncbi:MAG: tRNA lysidine(34) synthetase TilS [Marmoricola sp.]
MGLHPSVAAVRLAVRRTLSDLGSGETVVVACSGGADSLALLAATVFEARRDSWRVVGATVDHGLQPGSTEQADRVAEQMRSIGVEESLTARVHVEAPGLGPEAAAREARYAVLGQVAERFAAATVLLGHTLDDQAETVLLGLARGSGGRSLAGMRRRFDDYRRPLLDVRRAETEAACVAEGIDFWTDPHNSDDRFTRVRVRTRVLPLMERELGPGVAAALARTAESIRLDVDLLDDLAEAAEPELRVEGGHDVDLLVEQPTAILRRVLRLAALAAGALSADLAHEHVLALVEMVQAHPQRQVQLPGHVTAHVEDAILRFRRTT